MPLFSPVGRGPPPPRPNKLMVKANFFKLEVAPEIEQNEWVQYFVEIRDAQKKRGPDGRFTDEIIPLLKKNRDGTEKKVDLDESRPLSRRIFDKLRQQENIMFASDGGNTAYAASRLFKEGEESPQLVDDTREDPAPVPNGTYGPADVNTPTEPAVVGSISKTYKVKVKLECEEDDHDADRYVQFHRSVLLTRKLFRLCLFGL